MIDFKKYIFAFLLIIPFVALSQPKNLNQLSTRQLKVLSKTAIKYGDIYSAIDYLERYCELKTDDIDYLNQLAELYKLSRDYKNAEKTFESVFVSEPNKYPNVLFYLAQMQKMNGKYSEAIVNFEKFKKECKDQDLKKLNKIEIEGAELALKLLKEKQNVELYHLDTSINKAYIEFSPIPVSNDRLIYASLKADSVKYFDIEGEKKPVRKFYEAAKINDKWVGGQELVGPFNDDNSHTGNGAFSPDGNRFYFTRCQTNWENKVICSIYMSQKDENGKWEEPKILENGINDEKYTATQPTIGLESKKNLEVIYFVSDREGTKGGNDIWYMIYDTERNYFKGPKNVGSKINTEGEELSPYFDQRKHTLYFSSNGHPSIGGLDIFKSNGELAHWLAPENLGIPVNSSADDIYYVPTKNQKEAFFTSNREGGMALKNPTCCDDIYTVKYLDMFFINLEGIVYRIEEENINAKIDDKFIQTNLCEESIVSLYLIDKEGTEPILVEQDTTDIMGDYSFELERGKEYKIIASKDGYFNSSTLYSTLETKLETRKDKVNPLPLKKIPRIPIVIDNIYYEFSKASLTEDAKITIDTTIFIILNETPDIIVEISSHTDSVSSDAFNMKLSQQRAESVVNYLIDKGIERNRMIAKGYGESQPIARNSNPNGSDNPEGRAKNRRTEFKVIGSSNQFSILNKKDLDILRKESEEPKEITSPDVKKFGSQ
ncbi:MAG TPA: hypothetical protein DDX39_08280 [Bacteroidales bacterium]|nr:MAG: hypothetical protein A2W98_09750 [Bacteroidetes bacterium GWF2_33_38]OFY75080.1 MAG: hypothetical protein A2265_06220 [Bacteroidetes bacterium RIFOXYA12_FULL_33_9]HBF88623.1 hypothetical protein [Bacteroidales bacterium]